MKKLSATEIKKSEVNILKHFISFAKENNLNYFLAYGTLIGAIRHKGFIPWDDDIDIAMLRSDYDRLVNLAKENRIISDHFEIKLPLDKNYVYPFIKIIDKRTKVYQPEILDKYQTGIWIDIFPLDYIPIEEKELLSLKKRSNFYRKMTMYSYFRDSSYNMKSIAKNLVSIVMNTIGLTPHYWVKKLLKLVHYKKTNLVGGYVFGLLEGDCYDINSFEEYTYKQFEDDFYKCPKEYDDVLKRYYGNYMEIPKKENQKSHLIDAYEKE